MSKETNHTFYHSVGNLAVLTVVIILSVLAYGIFVYFYPAEKEKKKEMYRWCGVIDSEHNKNKEGKEKFKANCYKCHYVTDKKFIGPGLKDVEQRWKTREALKAYIKDSERYLRDNKNDKYAHKMTKKYNSTNIFFQS